MKTTTLLQRCCSILLCFFAYFFVCAPAQAQTTEDVPQKWLMGHDTLLLPERLRKAVANRAKDFDMAYLQENILPIMLMLEWVKNQCNNIDEHIPTEYCYLALCKNYLTDHKHTQSDVLVRANTKFWNLSDTNLKELHLEYDLQHTEDCDDVSHLNLTTFKMVNALKQANAYFQNWALTMLITDHGYEGAKTRVRNFYESNTNRYKGKHTFELEMYANIWVEYFALRYVLEPLIIKQKEPKKYLTCKTADKPFVLRNVPKNFHQDIHDLPTYNRWLNPDKKKVSKKAAQIWFVLETRQSVSHPYPYPKLYHFEKKTKKETQDNPTLPAPNAPIKEVRRQDAPTTASNDMDEETHLHVVKKAETWFGIAKKYAVSIAQIRDLNPAKKPPKVLQEGDVLVIRARTEEKYQNVERDKKHQKHENLKNDSLPKSFQHKKTKIRTHERTLQSPNYPRYRGKITRYPARLTPVESKGKKAYKNLKK